jgi:hypothetical protein
MSDPSTPITYDFGPHVEPFAQAAYTAYHQGRAHRPWEELAPHEQFRWQLVAEDVYNHPATTPQRLRTVYMTGINDVPWQDLKPRFRMRWILVWSATTSMLAAPVRTTNRSRTVRIDPTLPLLERLIQRRAEGVAR